jgi:tRNA pseudouridine55 synthase
VTAVGVLNLDKPRGLGSAAAVGRLRRSSGIKRVGHGGTLDPLASGVLPVFFGRATVLAPLVSKQGKTYHAGIRFGAGSVTDDAEGEIEVSEVPAGLNAKAMGDALKRFVGTIDQRPPAFSAIKVGGERSYRRARAGRGTEPLAPRRVEVEALTLNGWEEPAPDDPGPLARIEVRCGSGFYVRSLARDLGDALGTRALLESLVRTRVGPLRLEEATGLEQAEALGPGVERALCPPTQVLEELTVVLAGIADVEALVHGRDISAPPDALGPAYARDGNGRVLALGQVAGGRFHPRRLVEL